MTTKTTTNFKGLVPESWRCVDCGMDTGPGFLNRAEMEKVVKVLGDKWHNDKVSINQTFDDATEVFTVRKAVWKAARMAPLGGCLCIRCLERRLGRH